MMPNISAAPTPNYDFLLPLIDVMYDEIIVYDDNYQIVYINKACQRHYDCSPEHMIGKSFFDFVDKNCWNNSILPIVYKEKKAYATKQKTFIGTELFTIAVPVFDLRGNLIYVIMNVRDHLSGIPLYNPNYSYKSNKPESIPEIIARSTKMKNILNIAKKISPVDVSCILTGETGTGKTLLAKYIHSISPRSQAPFISLNCASIPANLIESELFGYEKGAFTGADSRGKKGLFEAAHEGTLLLDEISELPLSAQAKLLHVLQEQNYLPIGANSPVNVNVRILAATNKDLKTLIAQGQFREDLYYRLNVIELYLPPLRERREDIPELIKRFLTHFNFKYGYNKIISEKAMDILCAAEWKGNIRELRHVIERIVVTSDSPIIDAMYLPATVLSGHHIYPAVEIKPSYSFDDKINEYMAHIVKDAYQQCGSSRKLAAYLNISQTRANKLIHKFIK